MTFPRILALVVLLAGYAGFAQGTDVLASPPAPSVALGERLAGPSPQFFDRREGAGRFWAPAASTARAPRASLRQRAWNPYALEHVIAAEGCVGEPEPEIIRC